MESSTINPFQRSTPLPVQSHTQQAENPLRSFHLPYSLQA